MNRIASSHVAFCLALLLPALADAQGLDRQTARTADISDRLTSRPLAAPVHAAVPVLPEAVQTCRTTDGPAEASADPRWVWRQRAFHHLDCVTTLVDAALEAAPAAEGDGEVRVSRADLERIRQFAWWARDAAARIGQ